MIVFDVSSLIGATTLRSGIPRRALLHALAHDEIAVSDGLVAELEDVLHRPEMQKYLDPVIRDEVIRRFSGAPNRFAPTKRVRECRDPTDDKYLELALAAGAWAIVSSDKDLRVLNPWRDVRILSPKEYAEAVGIIQIP